MKRKKLMKRLAKAVKSDTAWRCWFSDHENYWYLYFLDFSDRLLLLDLIILPLHGGHFSHDSCLL